MRNRYGLVLTVVGLTLLALAWVGATKPFGAPDENAHYLRALGIANGQLLGPRAPYADPALSPAGRAWQQKDARAVWVPRRMAPLPRGVVGAQPENCIDGAPDGARSCYMATYTGDYPPLSYLLPAAGLKLADDANSGLWIGRVLSAIACVILLCLGAAALWNGSSCSLVGLLVAATPMVFFVSSVINPSGLEAASGIAFASAGIRVVRDGGRAPGWVYGLFAISGIALILAWQLGPVFAVIDCVGLALLGWSRRLGRAEWTSRWIWGPGIILLVAVGLAFAWDAYSGLLHSTLRILPLSSLKGGIDQLIPVYKQWIGAFGWLTIPLTRVFYGLWGLVALLLLVAALIVSPLRERLVLLAAIAIAIAFPVVYFAWSYRFSGFGLQGRYMIPLISLVVLLAGESVNRAVSVPAARRLRVSFYVVIAVVSVTDLAAWWTAAKAAANPHSSAWFIPQATWHPPFGWWPWLIVAVLGAALLLVGVGPSLLRSRNLGAKTALDP